MGNLKTKKIKMNQNIPQNMMQRPHDSMGYIPFPMMTNNPMINQSLNSNENCLYVGNLHKDMNELSLYSEFNSFGTIINARLMKNTYTNESRGFGFVTFSKKEEADKFFEEFNGKTLNGQEVKVERFIPYKDRKRPESSNLYIKNFFSNLETKEDIEKYIDDDFGKYGEITSKGVFQDDKLKKFYAFVEYKDVNSAKEAVNNLNDLKREGSDDEPLYVAIAQSKRQRKKMLQDQKLKQKK